MATAISIQAQAPGLRLAGHLGPKGLTLVAHDEAGEVLLALVLLDDGRALFRVVDLVDGEPVERCQAEVDTFCAVDPYAPHTCSGCDAGPLDEHAFDCPALAALLTQGEAA